MSELLSRINWVDVFSLILLIRISYTSSHIGVGRQILPLALLALILLITLYSYMDIATFLSERYAFTPSTCEFFTYAVTGGVLLIVYHLISRVVGFALFSAEGGVTSTPGIEKAGGMLLGVLRSTIFIGLILTGFLLAPVKFTESGVRNSYSGLFFIKANLEIYNSLTNLIFRGDDRSHRRTLEQFGSDKKVYPFKSFNLKARSKYHNKEK